MPMENQLAHAITQTEYDSSYDKAAKKLLANKQNSGTDYEELCE